MRLPITIEYDSDMLDHISHYWESHSCDYDIDWAMDVLVPIRVKAQLAEERTFGFPLEWDSAM